MSESATQRAPDQDARADDFGAPLDALLRRSGEELALLADRLAALEDHIGAAAAPGAGFCDGAARRLQDLDHMRQTAAALGDFLLRLSAAAPAGAVDSRAALAVVPLAALAARLSGREIAPPDAQGGDLELF